MHGSDVFSFGGGREVANRITAKFLLNLLRKYLKKNKRVGHQESVV